MLQIIALLAISWALIWFLYKKDLSVLGLMPNKQTGKYFLLLFSIAAGAAALSFVLKIIIAKETYTLSQSLTVRLVLQEIWYQCRTVLTEELLCRGAMLYILIKKVGTAKAIIISAIIFALWHFTNAGVWGNVPQMILLFVYTFAMGLLLAFAYAKSFSLLLPFAIHLGWNITQNFVFPDTATGNHIFISAAPPPNVAVSYFAFFALFFLPKILVILLNYIVVRKYKQTTMP